MDKLKRKFDEMNTGATVVRPAKIVYKVQEPEDEYEEAPKRLEQVQLVDRAFLAKLIEKENIIVDTGSNYNLIGRNLVKLMDEKLRSTGQEMIKESARKFFQFGGGQPTKSNEMIKVPINLAGKLVTMNVYVVEQNVPFLMGGRFLREVDACINMKLPALLLKEGRQVAIKDPGERSFGDQLGRQNT